MDFLHRTWAEIDLSALRHNFKILKSKANGCKIMAVVKADGYGHSASAIAPVLEEEGADYFAVSNIDEAIALRNYKIKKPILLKRGLTATYNEWLLAAEYILKEGNYNVILCERGIRSFNSDETRNVLDIQAIPYIKKNSKLPIIIDPSHASGKDYMIESMSKASLIAGADGLIIEVHTNPSQSLCDSEQTINIDILKNILKFKERIDKYEN